MADVGPVERDEVFTVSVPAGTLPAVPLETSLVFEPAEVLGVEIIIPSGHRGQTGIALAQAHSRVIPRTRGAFFSGDNEKIERTLGGYIGNGNWQALTFNEDVFLHEFEVRFLLRELSRQKELTGTRIFPVRIA